EDAGRFDPRAGPRSLSTARRVTGAGLVWIDAHCHLQFEERAGRDDDTIRPRTADETAAELVARAVEAGVERMVCIGTDLATSADDLRAAAAITPAHRLLVETDAPFLAPVPHRGRTNEPAFLPAVGAALAGARHEPLEAVAAATRANALTFFWPSEAVP